MNRERRENSAKKNRPLPVQTAKQGDGLPAVRQDTRQDKGCNKKDRETNLPALLSALTGFGWKGDASQRVANCYGRLGRKVAEAPVIL